MKLLQVFSPAEPKGVVVLDDVTADDIIDNVKKGIKVSFEGSRYFTEEENERINAFVHTYGSYYREIELGDTLLSFVGFKPNQW